MNNEQNGFNQLNQMENQTLGVTPATQPIPSQSQTAPVSPENQPIMGQISTPAAAPIEQPQPMQTTNFGSSPSQQPTSNKNNTLFIVVVVILIIVIGALVYFVVNKKNKPTEIENPTTATTTTTTTTTTTSKTGTDNEPSDVTNSQNNTKSLGGFTFTIPSNLKYQLIDGIETYIDNTNKYLLYMDYITNYTYTSSEENDIINEYKNYGHEVTARDITSGAYNYRAIEINKKDSKAIYLLTTFNDKDILLYIITNYGSLSTDTILTNTINNITTSGTKGGTSSFSQSDSNKKIQDIKYHTDYKF